MGASQSSNEKFISTIRDGTELPQAIRSCDILVVFFYQNAASLESYQQACTRLSAMVHTAMKCRLDLRYATVNMIDPSIRLFLASERVVGPCVKVYFRNNGETVVIEDVSSLMYKLPILVMDAEWKAKGGTSSNTSNPTGQWISVYTAPYDQQVLLPLQYAWIRSMLLTEPIVVGKSLGSGGFGEVCASRYLGTDIAVKIPAKSLHTREDFAVYVQELSCMHTLQHPHIQGIMGICLISGTSNALKKKVQQWCFVQPRRKESLSDALGRGDNTDAVLWAWVRQIASGLAFMHSWNFVHFDIKPRNILLDNANDALIADLGLSMKHSPSYGSLSNAISLGYCSPEAVIVEPGDAFPTAKADVYSFGVLMCEIFAKTPLEDELGRQMELERGLRRKKKEGTFELLVPGVGYAIDLPKELVPLAKQCMNFDPKQRPTMASVVKTLEKLPTRDSMMILDPRYPFAKPPPPQQPRRK
jgi:hypothetical protein